MTLVLVCGGLTYTFRTRCVSVQRLALFKLASMVESIMWNEVADILVAVADRRLVVWYYPHAPTVDKDLLQYVKLTKDW